MRCVFIHGPAGCGKLTIATALRELSGLALFHNHLAVDAALALFEFGSTPFVQLRHDIWIAAFAAAAQAGRSFVFTFHPEASVPEHFVSDALQVIRAHGGELIFVELTCSEAELERRIEHESRAQYRKLNSLEFYRRLRGSGAFQYPELPLPDLSVDTETHTAFESARIINLFLNERGRV